MKFRELVNLLDGRKIEVIYDPQHRQGPDN